MSKATSFYLTVMAAAILILFPLIGQTRVKDAGPANGPDVIMIDLPEDIAGNEMPAVGFLHAYHTRALENDCSLCHLQQADDRMFKFKKAGQAPSMEIYHDNCIACHGEKKKAGQPSGPLAAECRSCHGVVPQTGQAPWAKLDFDKSLHTIHEKASSIQPLSPDQAENCSACHHEYNAKTKQTYYEKGAESACIYCHKETETDNIRSMKDAAHDSCVACHLRLKEKDTAAGPVTCHGCHDAENQSKIKKADTVTQLKRNQPDAVFMSGLFSEGDDPKYLVSPVSFNHQYHEEKTDSCTDCHHAALKKCSDCHTPKGDAGGEHIRLEQAMHMQTSTRSCLGCHESMTRTSADCAGCHKQSGQKAFREYDCAACHSMPDDRIVTNPDILKTMALESVQERMAGQTTIPQELIPEKVTIGELSEEYKPSEFPHRKVFNAIAQKVDSSSLASAFHQDQQALCMGCHHNSEASMEPPKCASCHGNTTDIAGGRPHLKGAYHGQCITCHQEMKVESVQATDCVKCHEKK